VTTWMNDEQVVLCGSMSAYGAIKTVQGRLARAGIAAVAPEADDFDAAASSADVREAKRLSSLHHFATIKNPKSRAILVVNVDKDGLHDYIGPNAFAEIAVAFSEGLSIYLLQDIPKQYQDELTAWGAHCLLGNLESLERSIRSANSPSRLSLAG
jgi:hypothetical protein